MKQAIFAFVFATPFFAHASSEARGEYGVKSLCLETERTYFSCSVANSTKVVSLCGSNMLSRNAGYLKYRFGMAGKIELEYPKGVIDTQQKFQYEHYVRYRYTVISVRFEISGNQYVLYYLYDGEGRRDKIERGVSVTLPSRIQKSFHCDDDVIGSLSSLEDVITRKQQ